MPALNFTKKALQNLPVPNKGRVYYTDTQTKGLGLTITAAGSKTYFVRRTIDGQSKRIAIVGGKFPDMGVPEARDAALKLMGAIASGVNPVAERKKKTVSNITLRQVFVDYCSTKELRGRTPATYEQALENSFAEYWDKPLVRITEKVIQTVNTNRKKKAASAMRTLKALFNFAKHQYKAGGESLFQDNPVAILREQKVAHKYGRKKGYIKAAELPDWFTAVEALPTIEKEYFLFLLFTGVRADTEGAALSWDRINWRALTFRLIDTKNGEDADLPIPSYLVPVLKQRKQKEGLVFPIENEARAAREEVIEATGIQFTRHDLRRTFLTIGESEDISYLALKRLSNHKSQESDVTAGYIQINDTRLKKASEQLERGILKHAGRAQGNVVAINA